MQNMLAPSYSVPAMIMELTFGDTFNISNGGIASAPQVVADNNNLYVTWYNTTIRSDGSVSDNEILFTKSSDYGENFSNPIDLSNSPSNFSVQPKITVSGKNVYIVWFESGNNGSIDVANVLFIKSNDAGNSFSKPISLTNNPSVTKLGSNSLEDTIIVEFERCLLITYLQALVSILFGAILQQPEV